MDRALLSAAVECYAHFGDVSLTMSGNAMTFALLKVCLFGEALRVFVALKRRDDISHVLAALAHAIAARLEEAQVSLENAKCLSHNARYLEAQ